MSIEERWNEIVILRQRLDPAWVPEDQEALSLFGELRHALGFRLPDDSLDLIRVCAGAEELWNQPERVCNDPDGHETELGEHLDYATISFMGCGAIVEEYEQYRDLTAAERIECSTIGPVRDKLYHKRWVPFASDVSGGRFAIDLSPDKGGTKGQIIWIYPEAALLVVIAPTAESFLAYGVECLRYQVGDRTTVPLPPYQEDAGKQLDEILSDPECQGVRRALAEIRLLCRRLPQEFDEPAEFYKPVSIERLRKLEARLKTTFPKQLMCLFRTHEHANRIWRQDGISARGSHGPLSFGLMSEVPVWSKMLNEEIRRGEVDVSKISAMPKSPVFVDFAGAASYSSEKISFYVLCCENQHPLFGAVLLLYENWQLDDSYKKKELTVFAKDVQSFLEQGLQSLKAR